jgi:membrane protein implicated in regulation of membrane protease activity
VLTVPADFLTDFAWIFWLGLILIFLIVEVSTLEFTFLMIALGSLGGLISGLFGAPWWAQVIVACVLALLLLLAVRPPLLRLLKRGGDPARTLVDALIGIDGIVTSDFVNGQGHAQLANGETWTARLSPAESSEQVEIGDRVLVTAIDGATAVVVRAERNPQ